MRRIDVDFSELVRLGEIMMPGGADFSLEQVFAPFQPLDVELQDGKEIRLDDLDDTPGLLSVRGRQIVLYIKDHSSGNFEAALEDGQRGNRFHIAHCQALEKMKRTNRYERYVATNRLDGLFPIEESGRWGGEGRQGEARLRVCKYCLMRLNYKNSADYQDRQRNFETFSFAEFFSHYSTCFKYMPSTLAETANVGYTSDWQELSRKVRQAAAYICDQCGIDLSRHKKLCDVHHINGVKSDNRPQNLRVLCRDCHRKQPMHSGIYISAADMAAIRSLRHQQNKMGVSGWESAFELSDTSVHGDMALLKERHYPPPEIGYDLQNDADEVFVTLEVAWPDKRIAIHLEKIEVPGWTIYGVGEVCGLEIARKRRYA